MYFKVFKSNAWKVLMLVIITTILLQGYQLFLQPNFLLQQPAKMLFIARGTSFRQLEKQLTADQIIKRPHTFRWLARLMQYDKKLFPGAYSIHPYMNNWQVMKLLRHGLQQPLNITLHTASNTAELVTVLTKNLAMQPADLQALLTDEAVVAGYGFTKANVLAMFIPNTYSVYWNITPAALLQRLYKEYQQFWTNERLAKAEKMKLSPQEVYILASIVSKETTHLAEAPIIAGVYINRLKKGMKLQADPTITYIAHMPASNRVLKKHTQIDSPYNTYLYKGLPPGPITIPTVAMIDAVLNYQHHHYLYFVAKEDLSGLHYFAKNFETHKRNAQKYRRMLKTLGTVSGG
jgi:UPF0755 protein